MHDSEQLHSLPAEEPVIHSDTPIWTVECILRGLPEIWILADDPYMLNLLGRTNLVEHGGADAVLRWTEEKGG